MGCVIQTPLLRVNQKSVSISHTPKLITHSRRRVARPGTMDTMDTMPKVNSGLLIKSCWNSVAAASPAGACRKLWPECKAFGRFRFQRVLRIAFVVIYRLSENLVGIMQFSNKVPVVRSLNTPCCCPFEYKNSCEKILSRRSVEK